MPQLTGHEKIPLKIAFIVGNNEDATHCGVRDYAKRLASALCHAGAAAEVIGAGDWSVASIRQLRRELGDKKLDAVHVQYPSIGFRYSLFPHLLGTMRVAKVACVTLHEYSSLPKPQRLSLHLFRWSAQAIFFTTDEERAGFEAAGGSGGARHLVVPISGNVPVAYPSASRQSTVLYFGQIRPEKGIEDFLRLARLGADEESIQFTVVGSSLPRHAEYLQSLKQNAPVGVKWIIDAALNEVAEQMSRALAAYLPFPDGATYRRGSLLGALANGLPVITKVSETTPPALRDVILPAQTPGEAFAQMRRLRNSPVLAKQLEVAGLALAQQFSWSTIAEKHLQLYEEILPCSSCVAT